MLFGDPYLGTLQINFQESSLSEAEMSLVQIYSSLTERFSEVRPLGNVFLFLARFCPLGDNRAKNENVRWFMIRAAASYTIVSTVTSCLTVFKVMAEEHNSVKGPHVLAAIGRAQVLQELERMPA